MADEVHSNPVSSVATSFAATSLGVSGADEVRTVSTSALKAPKDDKNRSISGEPRALPATLGTNSYGLKGEVEIQLARSGSSRQILHLVLADDKRHERRRIRLEDASFCPTYAFGGGVFDVEYREHKFQQRPTRLSFKSFRNLCHFQRAFTGYDVVFDAQDVKLTSYWRMKSATNEIGRLQIWQRRSLEEAHSSGEAIDEKIKVQARDDYNSWYRKRPISHVRRHRITINSENLHAWRMSAQSGKELNLAAIGLFQDRQQGSAQQLRHLCIDFKNQLDLECFDVKFEEISLDHKAEKLQNYTTSISSGKPEAATSRQRNKFTKDSFAALGDTRDESPHASRQPRTSLQLQPYGDIVDEAASFFYVNGGLSESREVVKALFSGYQYADFLEQLSEIIVQFSENWTATNNNELEHWIGLALSCVSRPIAKCIWELILGNASPIAVEEAKLSEPPVYVTMVERSVDRHGLPDPSSMFDDMFKNAAKRSIAALRDELLARIIDGHELPTIQIKELHLENIKFALDSKSQAPNVTPGSSILNNDPYSESEKFILCRWEVPTVVRNMCLKLLTDGQNPAGWARYLRESLVLMGGSGMYKAESTSRHIENTWGHTGMIVLEAVLLGLSQLLVATDQSSPRSHEVEISKDRAVTVSFGNTLGCQGLARFQREHVLFLLDGSEMDASKATIDTISWICKAFRTAPDQGSLLRSSTDLQIMPGRVNRGGLLLTTLPLMPLKSSAEQCWMPLFTNGVVVEECFRRSWGEGLEISFDAMCQTAAIESTCFVPCNQKRELFSRKRGGEILLGFFTALVPIKEESKKGGIQWHLESSESDTINPRNLMSTQGSWLQTDHIIDLRNRKCFVGWCSEANVMLGTRGMDFKLAWTEGLASRKRTLHRKEYNAALQAGLQAGPAQIIGFGGATFNYVSNTQRFKPTDAYAKAITIMSKQVALIYESRPGRAWLVPKLSLLLHMSHAYFAYFSNNSTENDPVPFAVPSPDGASAALEALNNKGHVIVSQFGGTDTDITRLRQVLVDLNANVIETNITREPSTSREIFGTEYASIVAEASTNNHLKIIKAPPSSKAWTCIANKADAILICDELGPAIKPVTVCQNSKCSDIPLRQGYLTAHLWCLQRLLEKDGSKIEDLQTCSVKVGEDHAWSLVGNPFAGCAHESKKSCWDDPATVLQEISGQSIARNLFPVKSVPIKQTDEPPIKGAVVFGMRPRRKLEKKNKYSNFDVLALFHSKKAAQ